MLDVRDIRKTFFAGTPNEVRSLQGVTLRLNEGSFAPVIIMSLALIWLWRVRRAQEA